MCLEVNVGKIGQGYYQKLKNGAVFNTVIFNFIHLCVYVYIHMCIYLWRPMMSGVFLSCSSSDFGGMVFNLTCLVLSIKARQVCQQTWRYTCLPVCLGHGCIVPHLAFFSPKLSSSLHISIYIYP